jgi:hypothetical protein
MKRRILLGKCSFVKKEVFHFDRKVLGVVFFVIGESIIDSRREIWVKYV